MGKQAPIRSQRSKGLRLNHVLHGCILLAICIWLIYQMNRSSNNKGHEDSQSGPEKLGTMQSGGESLKLGRRDIRPLMKDDIAAEEAEEEEEEEEEGRGGGDDEIDGNDQERAEEEMLGAAVDYIDQEDGSRDDRIDGSIVDFDDMISSGNQAENEGLSDSEKDMVIEHYKDGENAERKVLGISSSVGLVL